MSIGPPSGGVAVIDTASTSQPPLWPSIGALLLAGWLGGIASTILWAPLLGVTRFGGVFSPGAASATWLAPTLAGALVASVLLPRLLRAFCEFELTLGSAVVVTLGRGLAGFAASTFLAVSPSGGVATRSVTLFLLPEIVSLAVGYQLLKRLAEPVPRFARDNSVARRWLGRQEPIPSHVAPAPHTPTAEWGRLLAAVRIEIAQTISVLEQAEHTAVPAAVAEALPGLEALADRVEKAPPPEEAGRSAQRDLVTGIRLLQGGLVDLAETAWRGDHRRELERLRGLDEIHHALAQLDSVR
jgi:hypothetical protein